MNVLTYAGTLENLSDIESAPNYVFERVDIVDATAVDSLFDKYQPAHRAGFTFYVNLGFDMNVTFIVKLI